MDSKSVCREKTMIKFVNAKINLGLNIVGRREDGYHNLRPFSSLSALKAVCHNSRSHSTTYLR